MVQLQIRLQKLDKKIVSEVDKRFFDLFNSIRDGCWFCFSYKSVYVPLSEFAKFAFRFVATPGGVMLVFPGDAT